MSSNQSVCVNIYAPRHIYIYMCLFLDIYMFTHACMHACMHACIKT